MSLFYHLFCFDPFIFGIRIQQLNTAPKIDMRIGIIAIWFVLIGQIPLNQYDLKASSTGKTITCDQDFCDTVFNGPNPNCKAGMNCEYAITYGDGSKTEGYFVKDNLILNQVTGNLQTTAMNGSVAFGCVIISDLTVSCNFTISSFPSRTCLSAFLCISHVSFLSETVAQPNNLEIQVHLLRPSMG